MTPRLSVVIPSRDCLAYLPAAIASIRAQSSGPGAFGPIEIVVVDDGSTDGTAAFLAEAAADPLLTPLVHAPSGVSAARNAGIAAAHAPIIAFLDADDQFFPGVLEARVALLERDPRVTLAFADVVSVTPEGEVLGKQFTYWPYFRKWIGGRTGLLDLGPDAFAMLLAETVCGTSTVIARKSAILAAGGFDTRYRIGEDWDLWLKLAGLGSVWCDTVCSTRYLKRPGSASKDTAELARSVHQIFRERVPDPGRIPQPYRAIARARLLTSDAMLSREQDARLKAFCQQATAFLLAPNANAARDAAYDLARLLRLK
ncbi:glycosyltransferase family 2 protein [Azorhizobium doebereinerae]|uniref:glycosyltransferase family 2 protein n=1 Tax=Azorhizobium doebereinerae TaxID=281091 RepID=UPI000404DB15|nr:glycosyltransferase [Azorhizobium doebereinerae]